MAKFMSFARMRQSVWVSPFGDPTFSDPTFSDPSDPTFSDLTLKRVISLVFLF